MSANTFAYRLCVTLLSTAVATLGFPAYAFAPDEADAKPAAKATIKAASRELADSEMAGMKGKDGRNPYLAGTSKWSANYKGVDLFTGNFTTSATDLSFEGGYGIPVNVTRAYSSNSNEEGAFGVGWTMSADIRTTGGGLLKSGGAPLRSVPSNFRERPTNQVDPNVESGSQPPAAVVATDASGKEETIQRDVDGVLTTPPSDKNKIDSEYETVDLSGTKYEVLSKNTVTTPEGTVYVYQKKGYYDSGMSTWGTSGSAEPSNILKITSATDRHGNVTTYTYDTSAYATYSRSNGTAKEYRLSTVAMPNGHTITFTYGNGTNAPTNRVRTIGDGTRTVTYGYGGGTQLTTVTTPGGKVTTYAYGSALYNGGTAPPELPTNLLTSVTDPRGMTTTITYRMLSVYLLPYGASLATSPCVTKIVAPNGFETYFGHYGHSSSDYYLLQKSGPPQVVGEFYEYDPNNVNATWNACEVKMRVVGDPKVIEQHCIFRTPGNSSSHILWSKLFDPVTQDLLEQVSYTQSLEWFDNGYGGDYFSNISGAYAVKTVGKSNFMGNPLRKTTTEYESASISSLGDHDNQSWVSISLGTSARSSEVSYAYWGKSKYWQQKAIRAGSSGSYRYSMTDYYDSSAATGSKGQTYKVYDEKRSTFAINSGDVPSGVATDDEWRYGLYATNYSGTTTHSAKFEYDSKGRPVDVWKIQSTPNLSSPSGWSYVQTRTTYNDSSGWYGMPQTVTEDYGSGKINRVTTTNAYDSQGRATSVTDAANRTFVTAYNSDGQVTTVTRTDTTPDAVLMTYSYGSTAPSGSVVASYGAVTQVKDQTDYTISGGSITYRDVAQNFTYNNSGVGMGQVYSIEEVRTGTTYASVYEYNGCGDRTKATHTTPNGTTRWHYGHYQAVGDPLQGKRAFQRMTKLDSSSNATTEEFHYLYDTQGRMLRSAFAQTAQSWSPSSGSSYYDSAHPASKRCLATYAYDGGGRLNSLDYTWQTWQTSGESGSFVTAGYIGKTAYEYELTGLKRGLRTQLEVYGPNSGNTAWELSRFEDYAYDADLDYLTSASYNDNGTGGYEKTNSWAYDAAGNRVSETHGSTTSTSFTYDNLNRMTLSPRWTGSAFTDPFEYDNDILGNRLSRGYDFDENGAYATYTWDDVNRMTKQVNVSGGGAKYKYRADGQRVEKVTGVSLAWYVDPINDSAFYDEVTLVNRPTTRYYHDGQMLMEEDYLQAGIPTIGDPDPDPVHSGLTRYGLGARGIDYIDKTYDATQVIMFPLVDGHGNTMANLIRSGSSYALRDGQSYDAWGAVRSASGTDDNTPFGKYCSGLGHQTDDESGLVYMRARYYEPWTGRFVSQDPSMDGKNWFVYARNQPTHLRDFTGKEAVGTTVDFYSWALSIFAGWGIVLPDLPKSAQIVANTIATIEMFSELSVTMAGASNTTAGLTGASMFLMGSSFAWVPAMFQLATSALRFGSVMCKVIGLATFAQCAILLYVEYSYADEM